MRDTLSTGHSFDMMNRNVKRIACPLNKTEAAEEGILIKRKGVILGMEKKDAIGCGQSVLF